MFGYVVPALDRLPAESRSRFQSAYCGLCHVLGRRGGVFSRFLLNYDFTFLAMLLDRSEADTRRKRCLAHPLEGRPVYAGENAFELAADESVILFWWKLRDDLADETFVKRLIALFLLLFLWRAYRNAARRRPAFCAQARLCLRELSALEKENCPSLDRTADAFARLLQSAAGELPEGGTRRATAQVLYHVGRFVYLADACDDLKRDMARGRYNPVAARFALAGPVLPEEDRVSLKTTMAHSLSLAASAYALLDPGPWNDVLENILYLGLPGVGSSVLAGTWVKAPWRKREKIGEIDA